ncbi:MAG: hypothetical protein HC835_13195 [Oscillatoriales cyanobacterium RM2_1_1]|nr:hypothetical protein [Oscillatoriales cyanobacterium SM2_3_0]NJO46502.1 hypothetical protein [Oscillatoriales cyanobacterium RM2_1_1]
MVVVICPGVHGPDLTDQFLQGLRADLNSSDSSLTWNPWLTVPTEDYPAYSGPDLLRFLQQNLPQGSPITLIGFSAGVVGATGAAWGWQQTGGPVRGFIALDGWGVPRLGGFPYYRLSHDQFTHWSSGVLGQGNESFYADPPVDHLQLWRSPQTIQGWAFYQNPQGVETASPTTATKVIIRWLAQSGELSSEPDP